MDYTKTIFEVHIPTEIAKSEYQAALSLCLAGKMSLDECLSYQEAVFKACNKNTQPFRLKTKND